MKPMQRAVEHPYATGAPGRADHSAAADRAQWWNALARMLAGLVARQR